MARRKSAKNEVQDPSLPLKKRARWRLIGACVLAMGAMIILPFALESEPRRELGDLEVRMPPRTEIGKMDRVLPTGTPASQSQAGGGAGAGAGAAIGATAAAAGIAAKQAAAQAAAQSAESARDQVRTALPNGLAGAKPTRIGADGRPVVDKPLPMASRAPAVVRRGEAALPKIQPAVTKPATKQAGSGNRAAGDATGKKTVAKQKPATGNAATKKPVKVAKAKPAKTTAAKAAAKPAAKPKQKAPPIPKRRTNPNSIKAASPSGYVVQIGAFSSMRGAKAQVARGSKLGFKPYTEKVKTSRGDRIRVRVGPYLTKKQATQARARLRAAGIDTALIAP